MVKEMSQNNDTFDEHTAQAMSNNPVSDEDSFFEQFESKKPAIKSKHARDARRRIEEYQENKRMAERLKECYD